MATSAAAEATADDDIWARALQMLRCHREGVPTLLGLTVVKLASMQGRARFGDASDISCLPAGLQQYILKLHQWMQPRLAVSGIGAEAITAVSSSTDLWHAILQHLPLLELRRCTATCRAHHASTAYLTRRIRQLGVCIVSGPKPSIPIASSIPRVSLLFAETEDDFPDARDDRASGRLEQASILDGRGYTWSILPRVTGLVPHLTHLHVDLSPEPQLAELNHRRFGRMPMRPSNGVGALFDCASFLHVKRPGPPPPILPPASGPEPWVLLPACNLTHLAITCEWSDAAHDDPKSLSPVGREHETAEKVQGIFLTCAVGSQRTLVHLDLTGLGPAVLPALVCLELPVLELVRIGIESPREDPWSQTHGRPLLWPSDTLSLLGGSFPTLTAVDVGYARVRRGVMPNELEQLCRRCGALRHLDLSMVMTNRDFSPCLLSLSKHAPRLVTLAIHGLELQTHALEAFAVGCPLLARVHFRRCGYRPEGLLAFLRAARNLRDLDLSLGNAHVLHDVLEDWLVATARTVPTLPVHSVPTDARGACAQQVRRGGGLPRKGGQATTHLVHDHPAHDHRAHRRPGGQASCLHARVRHRADHRPRRVARRDDDRRATRGHGAQTSWVQRR
jgi:hypothetical protein